MSNGSMMDGGNDVCQYFAGWRSRDAYVQFGLVLEAVGFIIAWPFILEYMEFGIFRLIGRALIAIVCWFAGLLCIFTGITLNGFNYSVKKIEARLAQSH
jgi:hypothetical protein